MVGVSSSLVKGACVSGDTKEWAFESRSSEALRSSRLCNGLMCSYLGGVMGKDTLQPGTKKCMSLVNQPMNQPAWFH